MSIRSETIVKPNKEVVAHPGLAMFRANFLYNTILERLMERRNVNRVTKIVLVNTISIKIEIAEKP